MCDTQYAFCSTHTQLRLGFRYAIRNTQYAYAATTGRPIRNTQCTICIRSYKKTRNTQQFSASQNTQIPLNTQPLNTQRIPYAPGMPLCAARRVRSFELSLTPQLLRTAPQMRESEIQQDEVLIGKNKKSISRKKIPGLELATFGGKSGIVSPMTYH